jgi:hypothetical protein
MWADERAWWGLAVAGTTLPLRESSSAFDAIPRLKPQFPVATQPGGAVRGPGQDCLEVDQIVKGFWDDFRAGDGQILPEFNISVVFRTR